MSFPEKISELSHRIPDLVQHLETEEATKNALILPFISALGYDIFNPKEVIPEYTADVGTKKGEKVDYAIVKDDEIAILMECKKAGVPLQDSAANQLFRYFAVTKARIAILTNGVEYRFFSDLDEPNRMDAAPFLSLNLLDNRESLLAEVRKLSKEKFNLEKLLSSASELKFIGQIKEILGEQLDQPDEELVRFFFTKANPGKRFSATIRETYAGLVKRALHQFISERVSGRLRSALNREDGSPVTGDGVQEGSAVALEDDGIITTEDEVEGYHIVKAILSRDIDPSRVVYRDTKSYMGVLLDDNNRKPICRLWFNTKQKYLGLFDEAKKETRVPIEDLVEIYKYETHLKVTASSYDEPAADSAAGKEEGGGG